MKWLLSHSEKDKKQNVHPRKRRSSSLLFMNSASTWFLYLGRHDTKVGSQEEAYIPYLLSHYQCCYWSCRCRSRHWHLLVTNRLHIPLRTCQSTPAFAGCSWRFWQLIRSVGSVTFWKCWRRPRRRTNLHQSVCFQRSCTRIEPLTPVCEIHKTELTFFLAMTRPYSNSWEQFYKSRTPRLGQAGGLPTYRFPVIFNKGMNVTRFR